MQIVKFLQISAKTLPITLNFFLSDRQLFRQGTVQLYILNCMSITFHLFICNRISGSVQS